MKKVVTIPNNAGQVRLSFFASSSNPVLIQASSTDEVRLFRMPGH
jgi:hypothetical protein